MVQNARALLKNRQVARHERVEKVAFNLLFNQKFR